MTAEQLVQKAILTLVKQNITSRDTARVIGSYGYLVLAGFEKLGAAMRFRTKRQIEAIIGKNMTFLLKYKHREPVRGAIEVLRVSGRRRAHVGYIRSGADAEAFFADPRRWLFR